MQVTESPSRMPSSISNAMSTNEDEIYSTQEFTITNATESANNNNQILGLEIWQFIPIVAGVALFLIVTIVLIYCLFRRKKVGLQTIINK